MKTINIILLVLIVIGIGLLASQKYWVPPLVSMILEREGVQVSDNYELEAPVPSIEEVPQSDMDTWNWIQSEVAADGVRFSYPNPLPTSYVRAVEWPPTVTVTTEAFECVDEVSFASGKYCVNKTAEGAAGSTFTTYEYKTPKGDSLVTVSFTLRTPQCMNYEPAEEMMCATEQSNFGVDALGERIAASVTVE